MEMSHLEGVWDCQNMWHLSVQGLGVRAEFQDCFLGITLFISAHGSCDLPGGSIIISSKLEN
jgi:hypothetical protein